MIKSEISNGDENSYRAYLTALKQLRRKSPSININTPRERYRHQESKKQAILDGVTGTWSTVQQARRIAIMASLVPDEIIYKHSDHSIRSYETALMFIDVSGFTELCEKYTRFGGGPSRLTEVLNSYIGAMIQEILTHKGDILKFSGDAFLSMWKMSSGLNMQDIVHTAIDCGLLIQKNYGRFLTDVGVVLKVKVAISAGLSHFSIIGGGSIPQAHYVIVGQPVWDVKMAEYMSAAGDVLTSASAWMYVNEAEYCTQPCGDGRHTKVLGVGASWKRVEKLHSSMGLLKETGVFSSIENLSNEDFSGSGINYREFAHRPAVVAAVHSSSWNTLRRFMLTPILRAVDNDEPMDFLTEVRHVVVVFLNIITRTVTEDVLIDVADTAYKCVYSVTAKAGGLVNKISMFDKDMMLLVVFGLRGLKHEDEVQRALECAYELKQLLTNVNICNISIGVTSGSTYCGVVGHVLRREYTVIGSAVNKAARLMIAYPDKVTCDKITFLKSKLNQECFEILERKALKGFNEPGPIYEFNYSRKSDIIKLSRHPILGRNEELRKYKVTLHNALEENKKKFTRYRDHKFGVSLIGPKMVGKKRLMAECLNITPPYVNVNRFVLTKKDKFPCKLIHLMVLTLLSGHGRLHRESRENKILATIDMTTLTPLEIYAINTVFDCGFPLPEKFDYNSKYLDDYRVKNLIKKIFKNNLPGLSVIAVAGGQNMDDDSWRILLLLLGDKTVFLLITITDEVPLSATATECLGNAMIVNLHLTGIDRWYHSALACQLLDVQAIQADLEKIIESASDGMPGWIQNFVISLVQRGQLTMVSLPRLEALEAGAVIPSSALLETDPTKVTLDDDYELSRDSYSNDLSKHGSVNENYMIQMARLSGTYDFENITVDIKMDALILKTYDSLTPFEKMLLKCASVLGEVFSRNMLLHLLQSDSPRKVAQAVAKLFSIRVLECVGGNFSMNNSKVLVHPVSYEVTTKIPHCSCVGVTRLPYCLDLPKYAFCGYMKFRHTLFRSTTYDLLTESQKNELHARALLYLERYTRRCASCGAGCFTRLLGLKCDDGLIRESEELKRTREQICALNAETKIASDFDMTTNRFLPYNTQSSFDTDNGNWDIYFQMSIRSESNIRALLESEELRRLTQSMQMYRKDKRIRPFSSLELSICECLPILLSAYSQAIDHCHGAGEFEKLFEAYLEYADLSIINMNIPQALHLLFKVEEFILSEEAYTAKDSCKIKWMQDFNLGRILSLRGACLLESGDLHEAGKELMRAMELFCDPFPTSKFAVRMRDIKASFSQMLALFVVPQMYVATNSGLVGDLYEAIAWTLNRMYRLFNLRRLTQSMQMYRKDKRIRPFSSLELSICECLPILLSAYSQAIDHCHGAGEFEKLFEAYLEYADLSIINMNIPQALHLLFKVEEFILSEEAYTAKDSCKIKWMQDFNLGRILSLRGACLLESGDLHEAGKELMRAMELFCDPFPTSKFAVRMRDIKASFSQMLALFVVPQMYVATNSGLVGDLYEAIAWTLNRMYRLFNENKETSNAALAAKWSMNYALRTDSNFRLLCISYGNMMSSCRQNKKFWMCQKLEKRSMELCQRKLGQVDVMEVHAVGYLYISIFLFYLEFGKKMESLEFGLSVMSIMTTLTDLPTRQILVLWILKLLLTEMRLQQMVAIMREFLYLTDHYDLSSETWYYYNAITILLDTGYSVESYRTCERFYIKKGETILRTKTPEAPWNFFVCMWLVTVRTGAWERSIIWEDRIKMLQTTKIEKHEYKLMIYVKLAEGFLIMLVREIDNRNIKKVQRLHIALKSMFREMKTSCKHASIYKPRFFFLSAYYYFIKGNKIRAFNYLNKASEWSKLFSHGIILLWIEHTRDSWRGTLNPKLENYWVEHIEADSILDYRDFDFEKGTQIIPYTLPLPKELRI